MKRHNRSTSALNMWRAKKRILKGFLLVAFVPMALCLLSCSPEQRNSPDKAGHAETD